MASVEILASLGQHRLLSTAQVRAIHCLGSERRWAQKVLARLRTAGLAECVQPPRGGPRVWFATEAGTHIAREAGALEGAPAALDAAEAASQLQAHTLAANDAAICFLRAARRQGDEFGPLSWRHEVFHPLTQGRGRRRRALCADAVLTYLRGEEGRVALEQRFLELDRATLSVDRLAAELARYADLYRAGDSDGEAIWRASYPAFPAVLCVLTGAPRPALERRRSTVAALLRANPQLSRTPEASISICLLEDLESRGPFAPIFREVRRSKAPIDWLRRTSGSEGRG
ncbi:MAG: replication-relaxation family protein [Thermoleophilia bacterium]|nr:replication-relaxation family protein [Thermoleophilia bacterium]